MIYSLLVLSSPASGHGARHAAGFARAVLARGHTLHRVFFLDDGAYTGAAAAVPPQDEPGALQTWTDLASEHALDLVLCVSSALRRGVVDETEARNRELGASTAHPAFSIGGLGQLVEAWTVSDRIVSFGG